MAGGQTIDHDVAIVGLGPTGATLANLLGLCGLSVLVLEKEAQIYDLPRAVHLDDEVMRVLQTIGIADEFARQVFINRGMRFVDREHKLLLDWPRPQQRTELGWHASYRFHQPDLERLLRRSLARFETIDIRLCSMVDELTDHGDRVTIGFRDAGTDRRRRETAKFVIGCDGARSTVRNVMGIGMERLGFEQRWLVADLLLKQDMPELGDHTLQYCDPVRPSTYCRNVGRRRRWEFALLDGEDSDEMASEETVWRLLAGWITRGDAELERRAVYTFKSEVAREWVKGRLLLAGDAAHLTPPFMGQGMCAGIRDAANLAWKLALCCKNRAPETLLQTYRSERKPNVTQYIETAAGLGALINRMGTGSEPGADEDGHNRSTDMKSIRSRLGPGLGPNGGRHSGTLFPQPELASGQRMDDHIGYRSVLIIDDGTNAFEKPKDLPVLLATEEPQVASTLARLDAKAILIRPDRYVLDVAESAGDMHRMMQRALPSPLG